MFVWTRDQTSCSMWCDVLFTVIHCDVCLAKCDVVCLWRCDVTFCAESRCGWARCDERDTIVSTRVSSCIPSRRHSLHAPALSTPVHMLPWRLRYTTVSSYTCKGMWAKQNFLWKNDKTNPQSYSYFEPEPNPLHNQSIPSCSHTPLSYHNDRSRNPEECVQSYMMIHKWIKFRFS